MAKSPPPFPEQIKNDFRRKPDWRWDRACDLIRTGRYVTKRRDDQATRIAVDYIREIDRCHSDLRLRRIRQRFKHLAKAHDIWQAGGVVRLEIETRILAGQSDTAIGLVMGLPAATVQAYADILFMVRDRLHAGSYVAFQVVGVDPRHPPAPVQLMQLCAYHSGPHMIQPWLDYFKEPDGVRDLKTRKGRQMASLDLFLATQRLSVNETTEWNLMKCSPYFLKNDWNLPASGSVWKAFRKSTAEIVGKLQIPNSNLPPYSYAPLTSPTRNNTNNADRDENRKAA